VSSFRDALNNVTEENAMLRAQVTEENAMLRAQVTSLVVQVTSLVAKFTSMATALARNNSAAAATPTVEVTVAPAQPSPVARLIVAEQAVATLTQASAAPNAFLQFIAAQSALGRGLISTWPRTHQHHSQR
jgi:hypothetical protein